MDATFSHIKAVFCDIDGTLLTSQHTVSPRTVAAIRALRERGVLFGLCTGRDAHATEAMYELWGIEGLVDVLVGCGGAEVIDRTHDINELSYPLPGETIARICKHMADLPATPVCPRNGVFYVPESNACVEHLSRVDGVPYQVVDFAEFLREPQPKVMFTMAPEVMPRVIERASTFADDTVKAAALQTTQRLYEFMDPRVSKTRGLVRVAELNDMGAPEHLRVWRCGQRHLHGGRRRRGRGHGKRQRCHPLRRRLCNRQQRQRRHRDLYRGTSAVALGENHRKRGQALLRWPQAIWAN